MYAVTGIIQKNEIVAIVRSVVLFPQLDRSFVMPPIDFSAIHTAIQATSETSVNPNNSAEMKISPNISLVFYRRLDA